MYVFPKTVNTLLPSLSTKSLEPTESVSVGEPLAIPTFESVVTDVMVLLKDTVFAVTLPFFTAASSVKLRISSAIASESITSFVIRLYANTTIFLSVRSVRKRKGVI